ncbi:serine/threonine-protein kinase [Ramlibacter tataouinensis]|uniref:non-specific serine/threonine protein kinase n=1 Tax=Ramlibacter tataouinensis (strain ATCC BAA-407 / DSM 14655 / LMG 21543 / TTB310) TaxID=365046 RepID=F5XXU7_RAMTT|nr:serine/threonine-protein kinase [Ramlibacter tataouinensis]AEG93082.1 protein kinase (serine/threonine-protein kinase)-like protein [Ramlibacter tataouinensis TTB310]
MSAREPAVGRFGRYRVLQELGRGAMGVVYLAEDEALHRQVAVKALLLPGDAQERADHEARFLQEAQSAGAISHPNIVTIHDLGREGEWLYIAMELLRGEELRDLMAQGAMDLPLAADLARQVAEGLAAAHAHGVVHRDIKPSNIMVVAGSHAKIMDFGVARLQSSQVRTQVGLMLGSPRYMSPEQVEGQPVDARSDIFSLGTLLYEMAAGTPPFHGEDLRGLLMAVVRADPPPPSRLNPAVPPELDAIVAKALRKQREERYQNAGELARALAALVRSWPVGGRRTAGPKEDVDAFARTEPLKAQARPLRLSPRFDQQAALRQWSKADGQPARRRVPFAWLLGWGVAALAALAVALR